MQVSEEKTLNKVLLTRKQLDEETRAQFPGPEFRIALKHEFLVTENEVVTPKAHLLQEELNHRLGADKKFLNELKEVSSAMDKKYGEWLSKQAEIIDFKSMFKASTVN